MNKIRNIFIANRGEIAVRIAKTAKKLGIRVVAPFTPNDAQSLHVTAVDKAVELNDNDLSKTFLSAEVMVEMALSEGCDAIHPGYGFLSEDFRFAGLCKQKGLVFIGPDPDVIKTMGDKSLARKIAGDSGVPVLQAYEGSVDELKELASTIHYPVLIKAVAGGGGKGLRKVNSFTGFETELERASREAFNYFGNDRLLIEPFIKNARHIEVQILADNFGNIIHLFERECSIQRNHQKIIEETPALNISSELKQKLFEASVLIAKNVGYTNAGTIEFLIDEKEQFFFLEMNTRIQVEHGVTEMVTGVDIVEEQIKIAQGEALNYLQNQINQRGHAVEARVYAEDTTKEFNRTPGYTGSLFFPESENLRVDTSLSGNSQIPDTYDPLLAKMIAYGSSRKEALSTLKKGLNELSIPGIVHNCAYLKSILDLNEFQLNHHTTESLESNHKYLISNLLSQREQLLRLALQAYLVVHFLNNGKEPKNIWESVSCWKSLNKVGVNADDQKYSLSWNKRDDFVEVSINGSPSFLEDIFSSSEEVKFKLKGNRYSLFFRKENNSTLISTRGFVFRLWSNSVLSEARINKKNRKEKINPDSKISSPLFGKVIKINHKPGDFVKKGEPVIILESMKMENNILAPVSGTVKNIYVSENENVKENQNLIEIEKTIETKNKEMVFQN